MRYLDAQVGLLIDGMDRMGRWANAGVVLASDHGESLVEHQAFLGHEHWLYDPVIRIPLLVRDPACADCAGQVRTEAVDSARIAATLARLAGIDQRGLAGGPSLHEEAPATGIAIGPSASSGVSRVGRGGSALQAIVRSGGLKVLVDEAGHVERYDLGWDPGERVPLVTAAERALLEEEIEAKLEAWEQGEGVGGVFPLGRGAPLSPQTRAALTQEGVAGTNAASDEIEKYDAVEQRARRALDAARQAAAAVDDRGDPDEVPDAVREALEALGYVE